MTDQFDKYADFYDAFYSAKNYRAEAEYVSELIRQYGPKKSHRILEFGAGSGKLARELATVGYAVTPTDVSSRMVAQADADFPVLPADIRTFRTDEEFDVAVAFFHVLSYLSPEGELADAFLTVSSLLEIGGLFIADFWFDRAVESQRPEVRVRRVGSGDSELVRIAEPAWLPEDRRVDVKFTFFIKDCAQEGFRSFVETHQMHYFSGSELSDVSQMHGLELVNLEETLTGLQVDTNTWGVTAVFRKMR